MRVFGSLDNTVISILFLFMAKNSIVNIIFGLSYERAI